MLGASGPVGRHLVPLLHEQGWEVVAVSQGRDDDPFVPGILRVYGDIPSGHWRRWVEGCVAAVNLASTETEAPADGVTFDRMHRQTAEVAVAACAELGIRRFLQLSAIGAGPDVASTYHRSKAQAEQVISSSGLEWTVLRTGLIFGPGDWISNRLVPALRRLPFFPLPGDATPRLQPTAASEVARALADILADATPPSDTVELVGPETVDLAELVRRTAQTLRLHRTVVHLPRAGVRTLTTVLRLLGKTPLTAEELSVLTSDAVTAGEPFLRLATPYRGPVWIT